MDESSGVVVVLLGFSVTFILAAVQLAIVAFALRQFGISLAGWIQATLQIAVIALSVCETVWLLNRVKAEKEV